MEWNELPSLYGINQTPRAPQGRKTHGVFVGKKKEKNCSASFGGEKYNNNKKKEKKKKKPIEKELNRVLSLSLSVVIPLSSCVPIHTHTQTASLGERERERERPRFPSIVAETIAKGESEVRTACTELEKRLRVKESTSIH